jgi:hypothetical protein
MEWREAEPALTSRTAAHGWGKDAITQNLSIKAG